MDTLNIIKSIASNFEYSGELVDYTELKAGNINIIKNGERKIRNMINKGV